MISEHTLAVATYIIKKHEEMTVQDEKIKTLTMKRLQKLLYFCDKAYREEYLFSMVKDKFVFWQNGPVITDLYYEYLEMSDAEKISFLPFHDKNLDDSWKNLTIKKTIDNVLEQTKYVSTQKLIDISKNDRKDFIVKEDNTIEF